MDNEKVKGIFWKSYNWFWNKWKDEMLPRESDKWDAVVKDAKEVMCEYDCRMCKKIILALLTELEERSWGNGGDNVRAYKVSKESELTVEEKLEVVKGYADDVLKAMAHAKIKGKNIHVEKANTNRR